jgi:hypothetical protein
VAITGGSGDAGAQAIAQTMKAVKGFRRLKGHKAMPQLVAALRTRDQQLGLGTTQEKVA